MGILDLVIKGLILAVAVAILLVLLQIQGCDIFDRTVGPATMAELSSERLDGATKLILVTEGWDIRDKDLTHAKIQGKAGLAGVLLRSFHGYVGDVEFRDRNGIPVAEIQDGDVRVLIP
ncbi:hypothetical protein [Wenzhouxiangella sp. EGI_FJ10305]|uniref:hypothetical protein n=1 Tax=Wenzhouxiangella sp. EGI_FJ10305 TaxID=3243768 RepID=UPI0035E16F32